MRLLHQVGLALLLAGSPLTALAQEARTAPEPTAAEIAAARAEGERLIAEAGVEEAFEYIGGGRDAWLLHRASGMVCRFEVGRAQNRVIVFETSWAVRGDDVGCSMPRAGADLTMYATRYSEPRTPEQAMHDAISGIQQRYPNWAPFEGEDLTASPEGVQTYVSRMIVTLEDGRRFYTQTLTADVDGWMFKQRISAPEDLSTDAQMTGAAEWVGVIGFAQARPFDNMD